VQRVITGYHLDAEGDWVAELSCGHDQHVRHRPPFQERPWVLSSGERAAHVGTPLDCPLCDRTELPERARRVRSTPTWDQESMPAALRRAHRLGARTWGGLTVIEGRLRFSAATDPPVTLVLGPGSVQAIPPEVEHEVEPLGVVSFRIDFYSVERDGGDAQ